MIAHSHGRRDVVLVDAPCFDRPVRLVWRKRTWRCEESSCPTKAFTEQDLEVAAPRVDRTRFGGHATRLPGTEGVQAWVRHDGASRMSTRLKR